MRLTIRRIYLLMFTAVSEWEKSVIFVLQFSVCARYPSSSSSSQRLFFRHSKIAAIKFYWRLLSLTFFCSFEALHAACESQNPQTAQGRVCVYKCGLWVCGLEKPFGAASRNGGKFLLASSWLPTTIWLGGKVFLWRKFEPHSHQPTTTTMAFRLRHQGAFLSLSVP